jgi:hypothetical protein
LIHFKPYGLGAVTDHWSKSWPMKSFRQHLKDEGHLKVTIFTFLVYLRDRGKSLFCIFFYSGE